MIEAAQTMAVTTSEWKYIAPCRYTPYYAITRTETGNSKEEQLYHLKNDLGERQNLAAEYPEKLEELKEILEKEKEKGCTIK